MHGLILRTSQHTIIIRFSLRLLSNNNIVHTRNNPGRRSYIKSDNIVRIFCSKKCSLMLKRGNFISILDHCFGRESTLWNHFSFFIAINYLLQYLEQILLATSKIYVVLNSHSSSRFNPAHLQASPLKAGKGSTGDGQ